MGWSRRQLMALSLIPKFSSFCTFWGCLWVMVDVLTDNSSTVPKRHQPYHRLLFAMSFYDWLESMFNFMSTWTIPADSPAKTFGNVGNQATCNAQGFFLQLDLASPMYYACLALYYLLVIKYGVTDKVLRKWVEPVMHSVVMLIAFGTASVSVRLDLFNSALLWCWIAPSPPGCLDSARYGREKANCVRGDNAWIYRWAFYFAPLWFCILFATVCTLMVLEKVRRLDRRTLQYRSPSRASIMSGHFSSHNMTSSWNDSTLNGSALVGNGSRTASNRVRRGAISVPSGRRQHKSSKDFEVYNYNVDPEESPIPSRGHKKPQSSLQSPSLGPLAVTHENDAAEADGVSTSNDPKVQSDENKQNRRVRLLVNDMSRQASIRTIGQWHSSSQNGDEDGNDESPNSIAPSFASLKSLYLRWQARRQNFAQQNPRTVEVFSQACFYLGAFYLANCWATTTRIVQMLRNEKTYFPLSCLHAWFDPFKGFMNFLVYQRPRYLRIRKRNPKLSRLAAARRTLQLSFMGRSSGHSNNPSGSEMSDIGLDRHGRRRWRSKASVSNNSGVAAAERTRDQEEPQNQSNISCGMMSTLDELKEKGPITGLGLVSPDTSSDLNLEIAAAIAAAACQVEEELNELSVEKQAPGKTEDGSPLAAAQVEAQTDTDCDSKNSWPSTESNLESPDTDSEDRCEHECATIGAADEKESCATKTAVSWAPGV